MPFYLPEDWHRPPRWFKVIATVMTVICLTIVIAALVSCAAPRSGRVADAKYTRAWTEIHQPVCSGGSGTTPRSCTPMWVEMHPDSWRLRLMNGDEDGWRSVTQLEYERCNLEEHYPECLDPNSGDER